MRLSAICADIADSDRPQGHGNSLWFEVSTGVAPYRFDTVGMTFWAVRLRQALPFRLGHATRDKRWTNRRNGSTSFEAEPSDSITVSRQMQGANLHPAVFPWPFLMRSLLDIGTVHTRKNSSFDVG